MTQEVVRGKLKALLPAPVKKQLHAIMTFVYWLRGRWAWWYANLMLQRRVWWPFTLAAWQEHWALELLADLDGPLTQVELRWLYKQVRALSEEAQILEFNPGVGQVTCCLALGCWGSRRHIYTFWPAMAGNWHTETGQTFIVWHQNIIRKHLVSYITPIVWDDAGAVSPCPERAALLYVGWDPAYIHTNVSIEQTKLTNLLLGALVVQGGETPMPNQQFHLSSTGAIGSLIYGRAFVNPQENPAPDRDGMGL